MKKMHPKARKENLAGYQSREQMILLGFMRGFLVWFVVYLFLQEPDGFFAVTADRVSSNWLKLIFLNVPLQLILTIIASFGLVQRESTARTRFGLAVAILNAVLIIGNIGLSLMTA